MTEITADNALRLRRGVTAARWARQGRDAIRLAEGTLAPVLDLLIRLYLAQAFLASGLLKAASWDTALALAANEYPVTWMDPVTAAYLGVSIELICPLFLALGLATRFAAVPLLILSLVIQLEYQALNEHLFWAVLFGWYAVMGAGPVSMDRSLRRGLGDSALPLAGRVCRLFDAVTRFAGPVYLLFVRAWIAVLLFRLAGAAPLPGTVPLLVITAPLLVFGLVTRLAAVLTVVGLATAWLVLPLDGVAQTDTGYAMTLLALLATRGPGRLSLDRLVVDQLEHYVEQFGTATGAASGGVPHVVIVGAGFGGLAAARALRNTACRVTVIDRRNYHLFQPLLYQVATAVLSPADIATPVREFFRDQSNARVQLGEVTGVDTARQEVLVGDTTRIRYDYLVLATGARHSYFGRDEWEPWAPGLKQVEDATAIRRRLLLAFEQAESTDDAEERRRLLTFVIIGAGPTGVELAGAIAELARHGMTGEFREIDPADARVLLVEAGPRLLAAFPEALSAAAGRSLSALGVEVLTGAAVEQVDAAGVTIGGQRIGSRTVFWAAGVAASPAASWVGGESDRAGRLRVGPDLSVPGQPNVFAIGDTAFSEGWEGRPVPGLAPAAKQGGKYVAQLIRARVEGRPVPVPFRYHHQGSLATIGRKAAVVDIGRLRMSGVLAWWLWGAIHILFLAGLRNRMVVATQWLWAYLTFRRGTRLITGSQ